MFGTDEEQAESSATSEYLVDNPVAPEDKPSAPALKIIPRWRGVSATRAWDSVGEAYSTTGGGDVRSFYSVAVATGLPSHISTRWETWSKRHAVTRLFKQASMSIKAPWAATLFNEITALREENDAEVDPIPASDSSMSEMIRFFASCRKLRKPTIVLTPAGNYRAEWRKDRQHFFGLEFFADGDVKFVLFAPKPASQQQTERIAGTSSWDEVLRKVHPWGATRWLLESG